jgi:hypothetical protein
VWAWRAGHVRGAERLQVNEVNIPSLAQSGGMQLYPEDRTVGTPHPLHLSIPF